MRMHQNHIVTRLTPEIREGSLLYANATIITPEHIINEQPETLNQITMRLNSNKNSSWEKAVKRTRPFNKPAQKDKILQGVFFTWFHRLSQPWDETQDVLDNREVYYWSTVHKSRNIFRSKIAPRRRHHCTIATQLAPVTREGFVGERVLLCSKRYASRRCEGNK